MMRIEKVVFLRLLRNPHHLTKRCDSTSTTVSADEVSKFRNLSQKWWDMDGEFKALHQMNALRVKLIQNGLVNSGRLKSIAYPKPLDGVSLLDIGCGGGILSEPLARLGAKVTGIDATEEGINAAIAHAGSSLGIDYKCTSVESFLQDNPNGTFDAVVASEVVEHVENLDMFLSSAVKLLKPNGSIFITTMNRTTESWVGAIVFAEYVCNLVPRGTHRWEKFITPPELQRMLSNNNVSTRLIHGMCYNPITNKWNWTQNTSINYAIHGVKEAEN